MIHLLSKAISIIITSLSWLLQSMKMVPNHFIGLSKFLLLLKIILQNFSVNLLDLMNHMILNIEGLKKNKSYQLVLRVWEVNVPDVVYETNKTFCKYILSILGSRHVVHVYKVFCIDLCGLLRFIFTSYTSVHAIL